MSPSQPQLRIALLASLDRELRSLAKRLKLKTIANSMVGDYGGAQVFAMTTGMGGTRAAEWLSRVVRDVNPQLLVFLGFAGALEPTLKPGDLVQPATIVDDAGQCWQLCSNPPCPPQRIDRGSAKAPILLCSHSPVFSSQDKARLHQTSGAAAVDTESSGVAERAASLDLPLVVLRAVSDTAGEEIPAEVVNWIDGAGHCQWRLAACDILRHPRILRPVLRLNRQSAFAAESLAENVPKLLDALIATACTA